MKLSFLFIFFFVVELTLDSTTSFIRSSAPISQQHVAENLIPQKSASDSNSKKSERHAKMNIECPAHAAVPPVTISSQFWMETEALASFADIAIPQLNPPVSQIDRPPIA